MPRAVNVGLGMGPADAVAFVEPGGWVYLGVEARADDQSRRVIGVCVPGLQGSLIGRSLRSNVLCRSEDRLRSRTGSGSSDRITSETRAPSYQKAR
ncbi:hypothetical protein SNOG_05024 [Parastagonospora nodorum SN15]|uniref:Uncharacterized protein n=1 Tax=Phaeosphaeria nodorum (strain SN15 / ATCC MYA-4574 / FGSC 10173) TaxID=321614 RepID=Q0UT90_PHANO|nr:hypothetical protein SNOG_05024 [Parastagonospora nodorum SN15]EAT87415.1 hypothetical protein SNOG_05024 [Parastagonospora nodorum SN15]